MNNSGECYYKFKVRSRFGLIAKCSFFLCLLLIMYANLLAILWSDFIASVRFVFAVNIISAFASLSIIDLFAANDFWCVSTDGFLNYSNDMKFLSSFVCPKKWRTVDVENAEILHKRSLFQTKTYIIVSFRDNSDYMIEPQWEPFFSMAPWHKRKTKGVLVISYFGNMVKMKELNSLLQTIAANNSTQKAPGRGNPTSVLDYIRQLKAMNCCEGRR